ncbi:MAG: hypothetical protein [Circular genetic element sp.]|nr:MAG: hypothetical protein [Circular genetic element sp.]
MTQKGNRRQNKKGGARRKNVSSNANRYRGTVARIPRPLAIKEKSVCQKLVYYNTLHCIPALNSVDNTQQNWYFTVALNSPWPFIYQWDQGATSNGKQLVPNSTIISLGADSNPTATTTSMPGLKDGYNLFRQYQNGVVLGTKVVLSAQPTGRDETSTAEQAGVMYAVKHAKVGFGLNSSSTINDVQKLPFRKMKRIAGPAHAASMYERNTGAYMTINHSPKSFNNVQSLRDNERFQFKQATAAYTNGQPPEDNDFLTVGIVPSLVNFQDAGATVQRKAPSFKLSMRMEQTILFTEPLENLGEGTGAYSLPWPARFGREFMRQTFLMN